MNNRKKISLRITASPISRCCSICGAPRPYRRWGVEVAASSLAGLQQPSRRDFDQLCTSVHRLTAALTWTRGVPQVHVVVKTVEIPEPLLEDKTTEIPQLQSVDKTVAFAQLQSEEIFHSALVWETVFVDAEYDQLFCSTWRLCLQERSHCGRPWTNNIPKIQQVLGKTVVLPQSQTVEHRRYLLLAADVSCSPSCRRHVQPAFVAALVHAVGHGSPTQVKAVYRTVVIPQWKTVVQIADIPDLQQIWENTLAIPQVKARFAGPVVFIPTGSGGSSCSTSCSAIRTNQVRHGTCFWKTFWLFSRVEYVASAAEVANAAAASAPVVERLAPALMRDVEKDS